MRVCVCAACATVATSLRWGSVLVSRSHSNSQLSTVTPGSGWVSSCLSTLPLGPGSARWPCNPLLRVKIHSNFLAFKNAFFLSPVLLSAEWRKKVFKTPFKFYSIIVIKYFPEMFFLCFRRFASTSGHTNQLKWFCCLLLIRQNKGAQQLLCSGCCWSGRSSVGVSDLETTHWFLGQHRTSSQMYEVSGNFFPPI